MEFKALTNYLNHLVEEANVPGADCIVYKDHEAVFRYFAGKSDIENNKDMSGDEIYIIFSMTKILTCTSALQLYEKGLYSMDDPVSEYMPEFAKMRLTSAALDTASSAQVASGQSAKYTPAGPVSGYAHNDIRVIDLFTMCAGLDYDLEAKGIKEALAAGKTSTRELAGALSETVLGFEPGTRFRYSLCHDVLGALVEIWSGKSLGEYMAENIFEPLGMKNTFFGVPKDEERLSRMAALYKYNEDGLPQRQPLKCIFNLSDDYQSGGAGLCSTTRDYALFLDALACGGVGKSGVRILSEQAVALMSTDHLTGQCSDDFYRLRPGYGYGLGVRVHKDKEKSGSLSPIGEFGWDGAAGAFAMADAKNKISLTYFQHVHSWKLQTHIDLRNALYKDLEE